MKNSILIAKSLLWLFAIFSIAEIQAVCPDNDRAKFWCEMGKVTSDGKYLDNYKAAMDSLDISVASPEGFTVYSNQSAYQWPYFFSPNEQFKSECNNGAIAGMSLYGPAYKSLSNDALILYPLCVEFNGASLDYLIESELIAANSNDALDISGMISKISDKSALDKANADNIIVYEYDITNPKLDDYSHCVALAFRKKNHYAVPVKILLNNEGLKNKDKYVRAALNSIRFGNNTKPEWEEAEKAVRDDEGTFPIKKYKCKHLVN